jgi:hypothetical protein
MDRVKLSNQLILSGSLLLFLSLAAFGCTSVGIGIGGGAEPEGGPPPHAPAHGYRAKHRYHYYPSAQIYFDLSRKAYFYMEDAKWRMSVSLPEHLRVKLGDHVTIDLDTDRPYKYFEEHKKKYPPGQLKKKKKKWK